MSMGPSKVTPVLLCFWMMPESTSAGSSTASAHPCTGSSVVGARVIELVFSEYCESEPSAGLEWAVRWQRLEPGMTQTAGAASRPPEEHQQRWFASGDPDAIAHRSMLSELRACSVCCGRFECEVGRE